MPNVKETLRTNIPLIIGIFAITILLFLSWYFVLQPFVTIVGVIAGAVISILSQFWTQRLALKREYTLKAVENIYSPLYSVILPIVKILEKRDYQNTSFGHWDGCVKDYRYFMVDETFRAKLDEFQEDIQKRSDSISRLENIVIPKIIVTTAKEIFQVKPKDGSSSFSFSIHKSLNGKLKNSYSGQTVFKLKNRESLETIIAHAMTPSDMDEQLDVSTHIFSWRADDAQRFESDDQEKNAEFWNTCLRKVENTEELQFLDKEHDILLDKAKAIKSELIRRIEKPWKI